MKAAVLSIGTELTRGELVNSDAAWLSEELTALGVEVVEHVTVDDDRERIGAALERLGGSVDCIVSTGGLGPTTDDVTTEAVANKLGSRLVRDEPSLERIRRRWQARGREMPESYAKQADFPETSAVIPNELGTAPGFTLTIRRARCFFLPGVPSEMKPMFHDSIGPVIGPLVERRSHQIHMRTFGMTESELNDRLKDLERAEDGVILGYRAHFPEIEVKVLARAESESTAQAKAVRIGDEIRVRLGDIVYGDRSDTYAACVGRVLRDRSLTLAIAESCTGGLIGSMLTRVPGSSEYLLLDVVSYANSTKASVLGVSQDTLRAYGAVSSETAAAMAEGVLRVSNADLAVSVTGIAGPGGGSEDKPVGTVWIGLAVRGARVPTATRLHKLTGDRERIQTLAAYLTLRTVVTAVLG